MYGLFYEKKIIQAAIETVYGTPPALVAADAILASNVSITPLVIDAKARNYARPGGGFGSYEKIVAGEHGAISYEIELAGSGAAGTAPAWGKLLRGAGRSETITALVSSAYKPVSASFDSLTHAFNMDGQLHQLTGCRGSSEIVYKNGIVPVLKLDYIGIWAAPLSVAMPTPDFTAWKTPLPIDKANTPTVSLFGVAGLLLESLDIKSAEKVTYRNLPNYESIDILGRAITGKISFQAPVISVKDWFSDAKNAVTGPLSIIHGPAAGSIIELASSKVQLDAPKYTNQGGIAFIEAGLTFIPSNTPGDDELVLTSR